MSDATWFSRKIVEHLAVARHGSNGPETGTDLDGLSGRERQVLELVCEGMTDAEISSTLYLSKHTVRNHLGSLYRKIHVARRSAAVVWARKRGLTGRNGSKQNNKRQK
ncbi:MAG: response regulator transcription factor [Zymomonas sp.]|nr:MAG: response regulator transcription factor [Zymomonas sp.]